MERIGVGSWGPGGQTRTLLHPCGAVEVPKRSFLGLGSLGAYLHHPSERAGGMEGKVWGERCIPGSGPAFPLPPRPGANPASYPLQLSRFLLLRPAALPQPVGSPLLRPSTPPAWVGRAGGGGGARGVSTLPAEGARSELKHDAGAEARAGLEGTGQADAAAAGPPHS